MSEELYDHDSVYAALVAMLKEHNNKNYVLAQHFRINPTLMSHILRKERKIPAKVAIQLGFEEVTYWRKQ